MPSKRRLVLRTLKAADQETRENSDSNDKEKQKTSKNSIPNCINEEVRSFESLFLENKLRQRALKCHPKYIYLFSEHYENIEKLLNSIGKSLKVKNSLPEFKMAEEIMINKISKSKTTESTKKGHPHSQRMKLRLSTR